MDIGLLILLIAAFLTRLPSVLLAGNLIDFDEATFALMAKRILEGELSVYASGHSYSGSLVSFLMAPWIALIGNNPAAIRLTSLTVFLVFVAIFYLLMKKIFDRRVAVFSSVFMVFMPIGVFDISTRVWGGHSEIWPVAALLLYLLHRFFDSPAPVARPLRHLFLIGFVAGMAVWINSLFFLFLIPSILFFALRLGSRPGRHSRPQPTALRFLFAGIHLFILGYVVLQFYAMIQGSLHGDPPFRMKELKKIVLLLVGEAVFLSLWNAADKKERMLQIKYLACTVLGCAVGNLPALVFNLLGGEGLRIFHKSGLIPFSLLAQRLHEVFVIKIPKFILGFSETPMFTSLETGIAEWILLFLMLALMFAVAWHKRAKPGYFMLFLFIALLTVAANVFSSLEAARYLVPLYWTLTVCLGIFLGEMLWPRSKALACILAVVIAGYFLFGNVRYYQNLPKDGLSQYRAIIDGLNENQVQGGFAPRSLSLILAYLSGEELVFSVHPDRARYLPYDQYAHLLKRRAHIFQMSDSAAADFRMNEPLFAKVINIIKTRQWVAYIVDEGEEPGEPPVPPYPEWRAHSGLHIYLNE
ncbi:MAG: glycosyltransferase family 39 protein [Candidatus Omnitrophota bacterium]|nr:glycosyltransferase family 39 protein [Candidatus Omnitrophota bacterium]